MYSRGNLVTHIKSQHAQSVFGQNMPIEWTIVSYKEQILKLVSNREEKKIDVK
jgi:hypothetical protein